jgi:hypothetical protein
VEISELKNNNIQNGKKKKDELKIRDWRDTIEMI